MKKVKAWETSDGETFSTVEDAQKHELKILLDEVFPPESRSGGPTPEAAEKIVDSLIEKADDVVNILTLKDDSRPAARKPTGTRRGRRPAAETQTGEQAPAPANEAA